MRLLIVNKTVLNLLLITIIIPIKVCIVHLKVPISVLVHEEEVLASAIRIAPINVNLAISDRILIVFFLKLHICHLLEIGLIFMALGHTPKHGSVRDIGRIDPC